MDGPLFISTLEKFLVPFLKDVYPDTHCFVQDNDPKHCSKVTRRYYQEREIQWWPTPPESLDLKVPLTRNFFYFGKRSSTMSEDHW